MGRMTAATSTDAKRAEWLLDRIKRGHFSDLSGVSPASLESLAEQAGRAFAALPESRETDRGRLMLLQGRAKLEMQARQRAAKKRAAMTAAKASRGNGGKPSERQRAISKTSDQQLQSTLRAGTEAARQMSEIQKEQRKRQKACAMPISVASAAPMFKAPVMRLWC